MYFFQDKQVLLLTMSLAEAKMYTDMVLDGLSENVSGGINQEDETPLESVSDADSRINMVTMGLAASIENALESALQRMNITPQKDLGLSKTQLLQYILETVSPEVGERCWDEERGVLMLDTTVIGDTINYQLTHLKKAAEQVAMESENTRTLLDRVISGISTGAVALAEGSRRALRKAKNIA